MRFYWDAKFRKNVNDSYLSEKKELKPIDMQNLKRQFKEKLDFLRNQRA